MKSLKITFGTSPADRAMWNEIASAIHFTIPAHFTITKTATHIRFGAPPQTEPSLPISSILPQLREEYLKIVPHLSELSQEILWCILNTDDGWVTREDLIDAVWKRKDPESNPESSTIHKATSDMNAKLIGIGFGYTVKSRRRIHYLTPISR
jgi:hypothetical protein